LLSECPQAVPKLEVGMLDNPPRWNARHCRHPCIAAESG
jgi:hypothetical protein